MGADCIHSDPNEGVHHSRDRIIHTAMIRAAFAAARFFDQQNLSGTVLRNPSSQPSQPAVGAQTHRVEWISSDDTEGGE